MRWIHYHATLPVFFDKADSKATRLGAKRPKWVGESFPHAPQGLSRSDWELKCMKGADLLGQPQRILLFSSPKGAARLQDRGEDGFTITEGLVEGAEDDVGVVGGEEEVGGGCSFWP